MDRLIDKSRFSKPATHENSELKFTYKSGDKISLKKDKFWRERGKTSKLLDIRCIMCEAKVLLYQKDGKGKLHRCYIDRIYDPPKYSNLQIELEINTKNDMPILKCPNCNEDIGYPILHWENRLAYRLIYGKWKTNKSTVEGIG